MKDMFYNYDHNINKDLQKKPPFPPEYPDILESDPNISIIKDAKGREIGVRVKQGMPFTLYFYLDDYTNAVKVSDIPDICEFIKNCSYHFEIVTNRHKVIYEVDKNVFDNFDTRSSKLKVEVPQEVADLLSKDTYRLRLTLRSAIDLQDKFVYTLFDDDDGLLIVR